jgi:hypothetical protein
MFSQKKYVTCQKNIDKTFLFTAVVKILNIEIFGFSRTVSHFMEENICFELVSVICGLEPGGGLTKY